MDVAYKPLVRPPLDSDDSQVEQVELQATAKQQLRL